MSIGQNAFDLLGQAIAPVASTHLPGKVVPQLKISWGEFRRNGGSSVRALLLGPRASKKAFASARFFKDSWVEGRIPKAAILAAALWHIVFLVLPTPRIFSPAKINPALQNAELTWSGPIADLPLLEIPRTEPKAATPSEPEPPAPVGADAFHPRQRIFTDPVHPTHPRQTLINPKAPLAPPAILPALPNIVQFQQAPGPARPQLQVSEEFLKKLHPRETRAATVTAAPLPDLPNAEQRPAEINLALSPNAPARPKLEINAGAAPRIAQRNQTGDPGPAPEVGSTQITAANGGATSLIALSAAPAPPAPVAPPAGNTAARISISPEGKQPGVPGGSAAPTANSTAPASNANAANGANSGAAGKNPVGISISGGNPPTNANSSGLSAPAAKISAPRPAIARPEPKKADDDQEKTEPPNFSALPPGAKPEQIFASKRVYTLNANMPNLNTSTGSWVLNFSELRENQDFGPHVATAANELTGPAPIKKVDPKYPPTLINERVEGEVILYAVIRRDGSVDGIQLVRSVDPQLDANAISAMGQWKFRPALKQGAPVEVEAIVHIPFRLPPDR
ncbi:MAG TPA: TonB family protein [Candidatus Acidoferrum sp.]|jgi:TonB family protein